MHNGSQNSEICAQLFCCDVCGKVASNEWRGCKLGSLERRVRMETTFAVSCQSSDSVPSRLKDEAKMIQARVMGKVETRSKRRSRVCWKDVAEPERWCLDGGAVRVGKTWRSRKGGAWMAEPCMLERRGGAGKVVLGWWSRVCWEQTLAEAEPQKLGLDGGAVRVGKTWRSRKGGAWMAEPCLLGTEGRAGTQLDEAWKAKPKSTKENTRTTKGSEDGRHKHLRKQNISCQKENKSLETIVFSVETNVLRKRLKQHEKTNTVPQWWKGLFFRKKPKFA